jgi:hypothetical protein
MEITRPGFENNPIQSVVITSLGEDGYSVAVTLKDPSGSKGTVVGLASSEPSFFKVAGTVTVDAGQSSQEADASTGPVAASKTVTVTATLDGYSRQGSITVQPPVVTQVLLNDGSSVYGNGSPKGASVWLDSYAASNLAVPLTSSDPAVNVPPVVYVLTGQNTVNFDVIVAKVTSDTPVTLTATLGPSVTEQITVKPFPAPTITEVFIASGGEIIIHGTNLTYCTKVTVGPMSSVTGEIHFHADTGTPAARLIVQGPFQSLPTPQQKVTVSGPGGTASLLALV